MGAAIGQILPLAVGVALTTRPVRRVHNTPAGTIGTDVHVVTLGHMCTLTRYRLLADVAGSSAGHLCPGGGDVRTHRYRIIVAGGLSEIGREAFSDFRIDANGTNTALIRDLDRSCRSSP